MSSDHARLAATPPAVLFALFALAFGACGGYVGEKYLYLEVAAEGIGGRDAALVIDTDRDSANYGAILKHVDFGTNGNEPYHTGLSADRRTVYYLGLFSPGRIWKTDITNPQNPILSTVVNASDDEIGANDPSEFVGLPDGRFLVSFMGSAMATAPGAIALFNADATKAAVFDNTTTSSATFNPHGLDVRTDIGRMANGTFIMPKDAAGLDQTPLGDTYRGDLVVWSFDADRRTASVIHTYDLQMGRAESGGIIDVKMLKGDTKGRVYATNMRSGEIWLATTVEPFEAAAVITDLKRPQRMQLTNDAKTLYVSTFDDDKIHEFDISDPSHPVELAAVQGPEPDSGPPSGAHFIKLSTDEKRLYCTSYFVNLKDDSMLRGFPNDIANTIDFSGSRHLWVIDTETMGKIPEFDIKFSGSSFRLVDGTEISGGPFGPHGVELDQ